MTTTCPSHVFEQYRECLSVAAGLVGGEGFAVDASSDHGRHQSAAIDAGQRIGTKSVLQKASRAVEGYLATLDDAALRCGERCLRPKFVSPSDPAAQSELARCRSQHSSPTADDCLIDVKCGVILGAKSSQASPAGRRSSACPETMIERTRATLWPESPSG